MTLRFAAAGDAAAIGALAEAAGLFPAEMADALLGPAFDGSGPDDVWIVAEDGGDLVGFAYTAPEKLTAGTYNMLAIATAPDVRGRGIGRALVERTERALTERSARLLIVETSSQPQFEPTRGFYARLGYREVARIPDFWDAGDDKIICSKNLNAPAHAQ